MIIINPERTENLIHALTEIWEKSVKATHFFLTEKDIRNLIPFVKTGIVEVQVLIVAQQNNKLIGFIGIQDEKIEMLFISPEYFGKRLGKKLVKTAMNYYSIKYVDVNEQNLQTTGFYHHLGFKVFERRKTDRQGNPFPLLCMKLETSSPEEDD